MGTSQIAMALLRDGLGLTQVSDALSLPHRLVLFWARQSGLSDPLPEDLRAQRALVVALLRDGVSEVRSAEQVGVSVWTVRLWHLEAEARQEPLITVPFTLVRDAGLRAIAEGWAMLDVAHLLGVDNTTVREWARRAGVRPSLQAERAAAQRAAPELQRRLRVSRYRARPR